MIINASYDSTLTTAPGGFVGAVTAAVAYFERTFSDAITVNVTFRFASLGGGLAQSSTWSEMLGYSAVRAALAAHDSVTPGFAAAALPLTNPFGGTTMGVSTAEARVLGLDPSVSANDGTVTLGSGNPWNYGASAVAGQFNAISALMHEISEVLGRAAGGDGALNPKPLALYRYSAPGIIDLSDAAAGAYFSVDGGAHEINPNGTFTAGAAGANGYQLGEAGSDIADWGVAVRDDPFGYGSHGEGVTVSAADLTVLQALGYTLNLGGPGAPVIGSPSNGTVTASARPLIQGTGVAGDRISVSIDGGAALTALVAANGAWSVTPPIALANGAHSVVATQTDALGNVSPVSAVDRFTVTTAANGGGVGDVHMTTYDGVHYDFQADGTFVLTRSTVAGNRFEIDIETAAEPGDGAVSLTTAVRAQVGADVLIFDIADPAHVLIDGTAHAAGSFALAGGTLSADAGGGFTIDWATGERLTITSHPGYFDTSVTLPGVDGPGSVQGLLGSRGGEALTFQLPDGTALARNLSDQDILGVYAHAWSVPKFT